MGCVPSRTASVSPSESSCRVDKNCLQEASRISPKDLSFRHVMADPLGREYFVEYLAFERAEENLLFFQGVERLKGATSMERMQSVQGIVQSYVKPGVETEVNISDNLKRNILQSAEKSSSEDQLQELLKYLQVAQKEVFMIMSMGAFPRFAKSTLFQEYIRRVRDEEELRLAVQAIQDQDLMNVSNGEFWLTSFAAAVQNLPICVSISSTVRSPDGAGFPLVHVNPCFEQTTGYSRAEVVGKNCRLLQADKAEKESIARLSLALSKAEPVKVVITNVRKDGTPFRNLLALTPIWDDSGAYRYVVGLQFDVTQSSATPAKLKLVDELLKMLTMRIPVF